MDDLDRAIRFGYPSAVRRSGIAAETNELAKAVARIEELAETSAMDGKPDWTAGSRASFSLAAALIRGADSLDAAWEEAEAALPEGAHIDRLVQVITGAVGAWTFGDWQVTVTMIDRERGWFDEYRDAYGETPAAALRALAAKLRDRAAGRI